MNNYESAEHYLTAAQRVREHMIRLEEEDNSGDSRKQKLVTQAQLDHAIEAIRNFALLAQAHAALATIDELREREDRLRSV